MNTKIIPLLIFCFSTHFIVFGQSTNNTDTKPLLKAKIIKGDVFEPKEFEIDLTGQIIKTDVHGHLSSGNLKKSLHFGYGFYVHNIHFFDNGDNIIIFFEITDDEGSSNDVYCLNKKTLRVVWKNYLWSFNLTVGQSEHDILYGSAGENAYSLDLKAGKILWQTKGLYFRYHLDYFDKIDIAGQKIILRGISHMQTDIVKTAILNKLDGKILSVK